MNDVIGYTTDLLFFFTDRGGKKSVGTNGLFSYLRERIIIGFLHDRDVQTELHSQVCGGGFFYTNRTVCILFQTFFPLSLSYTHKVYIIHFFFFFFFSYFCVVSLSRPLSWLFVDLRSYCYQINF